MPVTLLPEQEAEVQDRVASGRYSSSASVIGEALTALREKEEHAAKRAVLVADLDAGIASLDAGAGVPLTRELLESVKESGRERLAGRTGTTRG